MRTIIVHVWRGLMPDLDPPLRIKHDPTVRASRACIVVVCAAGWCSQRAEVVLEALRPVISGRPHSVLVRASCVRPDQTCREDICGLLVRVLPCSSSQRPNGPSVLVGPIRTSADVHALCGWLKAPELAPSALPTRLRRHQDH